MKTYLASTLTVLVAAACGGSDLEPGAGDDVGDGTQTLLVEGSVRAEPRVTNARAYTDFDVEMSLRVTKAGAQVTTGTVTMTSSSATIDLVYDPQRDNGRWVGSAPVYDEVYVLDVVSGDDNVIGVRVDGPDPHFFGAPMAGATVDSTMPLELRWSREDGADSAIVRTKNVDDVAIADSGSYMLSPGALEAKKDTAQENEIRLRRVDRITPAGGAVGSQFEVSLQNRITVVAQPNPAL